MNEIRDNIDRQLIGLLLANGRESTTALARKLGIGRTTVHERMARLEKSGVIAGYSAILSQDPFQEATFALVMLDIVQKRQREVLEGLKALPEVMSCFTISGDYDLAIVLQAPRVEDIDAVLDEILHIAGVESCRSWIVLGKHFQRGASALGTAVAGRPQFAAE
ncbi:Lrp/AsnC family transcriptional regulator [Chelativorans sp.]|uniref:Lrp/AsnC family transcriptional regulator n=1 Tax=Chelativorans sp. TaxID=2203393 RepID=UPI002811C563|nr:Lrp/AsnC family transcriptional regulator [Chelativorans sp.]